MDIIISNASEKPIYDQIYSQVKAAIMKGVIKEGDALPSHPRARKGFKDQRDHDQARVRRSRTGRIYSFRAGEGQFCGAFQSADAQRRDFARDRSVAFESV